MGFSYNSNMPIKMKLSLFSLPALLLQAQAAMYYDQASCASHTSLLIDNGMTPAIQLVNGAIQALGSSSGSNAWSFPHTEARDLAGRIFGKLETFKYNPTKNNFKYIADHYQPATTGISVTATSDTTLTAGDVLYYCDMKRLNKVTESDGTTVYQSTTDDREVWSSDDYSSCSSTKVTLAVFGSTLAATVTEQTPYAIIQICPWFLKQEETRAHHTVSSLPRYWWYSLLGKVSYWGQALLSMHPRPVDLINLWDVTMVHELTHAVVSNSEGADSSTRLVSTTDHGGPSQAYGWYNIYNLRQDLAFNADSLAYFAMGAEQLGKGNRINSDGSMSDIQTTIDLSQNNNVIVDGTWAPTRMRIRGEHSHEEEYYRINARAASSSVSRSSSGTQVSRSISASSSSTGKWNSSTLSTTSSSASRSSFGTQVSQSVSTSASGTGKGNSSTIATRSSTVSQSSSGSKSLQSASGSANTTSISKGSAISTGSRSGSSSASGSNTSKSASASSKSTGSSGSSSSSSNSSTPRSSSSGGGGILTPTVITESISGSVTLVSTSVSVKTTASGSSVDDDYIWSPTVTAAPSTTQVIPVWASGNTESSSSISVYSATGLYIPSITNIAAYPTVTVKDPKPTDTNNVAVVPFVKITLPKDKCAPIPKASGGGLLGLAFNFASDVVNGVLDSACHLVFPVVIVDGAIVIGGTLPPFVALDIFPPAADFPPAPDGGDDGDENDDDNNTSTGSKASGSQTSTSASSTSSSSCSASGVAHCTNSCAVSVGGGKTATSSCSQVCTTITTCSGTATTGSTASTITGSVVPLSLNDDTPLTDAWYTAQDSLLDDLIAQAPSVLDASQSAAVTATAWGTNGYGSGIGIGTGGSTLTTSTSRNSSSSTVPTSTSVSKSPPTTSSSPPRTTSSAPPPTTSTSPPPPTTTTTSAPSGPTGFHVVALKCSDKSCQDALEIVPSAQDSCDTIAANQEAWWGAAFPHPAEQQTESNANEIEPFTLLKDSQDFDVLYVFGDDFSADLCGTPKLNFTFTQSTDKQWTWLDTDNKSGTCTDNTGAQESTCSHNDLTYTAQELLVCVEKDTPGYCASVSV